MNDTKADKFRTFPDECFEQGTNLTEGTGSYDPFTGQSHDENGQLIVNETGDTKAMSLDDLIDEIDEIKYPAGRAVKNQAKGIIRDNRTALEAGMIPEGGYYDYIQGELDKLDQEHKAAVMPLIKAMVIKYEDVVKAGSAKPLRFKNYCGFYGLIDLEGNNIDRGDGTHNFGFIKDRNSTGRQRAIEFAASLGLTAEFQEGE